jgi:probable addiction module antidote protein
MKTKKWNIYDELKTEEDIQAFVEASVAEAEHDTDPSLLAHALGVAARARGMLSISRKSGVDRTGLYRSFVKGGDPRISTFDKVARSVGYHLSLVPLNTKSRSNANKQ